jgi:hypothetical protein
LAKVFFLLCGPVPPIPWVVGSVDVVRSATLSSIAVVVKRIFPVNVPKVLDIIAFPPVTVSVAALF